MEPFPVHPENGVWTSSQNWDTYTCNGLQRLTTRLTTQKKKFDEYTDISIIPPLKNRQASFRKVPLTILIQIKAKDLNTEERHAIYVRLKKEPSWFRVSLSSKNVVFNRTIEMDLMKIDMETALHVNDKDKKFSSVPILDGETGEKVREAF